MGPRSGVNLHHPQTAMAGDTSGPGIAMYFFVASKSFGTDKILHVNLQRYVLLTEPCNSHYL